MYAVTTQPPMLYTHDLRAQTLTAFPLYHLDRQSHLDWHACSLGRQYSGHVLLHDGSASGFCIVDAHNGFCRPVSIEQPFALPAPLCVAATACDLL